MVGDAEVCDGGTPASTQEGLRRWKLPTRGCIRQVHEILADDIYIGREHRDHRRRFLAASKWANPFKLREYASAAECVSRLDACLRGYPALVVDFFRSFWASACFVTVIAASLATLTL